MSDKRCYLSLCIPTNGMTEWVVPVLESILRQNADPGMYEIVVADNGNNKKFESKMAEYIAKYENIVYKKTSASGFLNQIEAFKAAKGEFIKFVNHRMLLKSGTVEYLIQFSKKNNEKKPAVFFTNGGLHLKKSVMNCISFDEYMKNLGYYSSWSAGLAFWNDQTEGIVKIEKFNPLFPHMDILFLDRENTLYH